MPGCPSRVHACNVTAGALIAGVAQAQAQLKVLLADQALLQHLHQG